MFACGGFRRHLGRDGKPAPWQADLPRSARTTLTAREMQVMELVERGLKNRDIGAALGIRTGTVKIT